MVNESDVRNIAKPEMIFSLPTEWRISAYLIINAPTGIKYSNQSGGNRCCHPVAEGYIIPIDNSYIAEIDDCSFLCWNDSNTSFNDQSKSADELDIMLSTFDEIAYKKISILIDRDRLSELTEAWWPVKGWISGYNFICDFSRKDKEFDKIQITGYIAKPNCD